MVNLEQHCTWINQVVMQNFFFRAFWLLNMARPGRARFVAGGTQRAQNRFPLDTVNNTSNEQCQERILYAFATDVAMVAAILLSNIAAEGTGLEPATSFPALHFQ
jgi:hypothetical protein